MELVFGVKLILIVIFGAIFGFLVIADNTIKPNSCSIETIEFNNVSDMTLNYNKLEITDIKFNININGKLTYEECESYSGNSTINPLFISINGKEQKLNEPKYVLIPKI